MRAQVSRSCCATGRAPHPVPARRTDPTSQRALIIAAAFALPEAQMTLARQGTVVAAPVQ
ncbi:hypothetical protein BCEN4_510033 [Burkholderia cenocepacia]|nr:hypothetical protein BCEN4_510033 [Burkholderia cenocepacia]